ncbi:zinc-dependent alcohol dehydrogenase family protein [Streptomyces sp. NBC_01750]|uniref:zinc-dependent alcohol dehydrogenase family protein n=1 Tax=Streptomyces sp. NBC_01750 TaxID=2975928 RepID=UPI002DD80F3A|nr:zinc-dependent alcohol dehydrogenase family protein [Streptomyces sp. NBC_01750]WSD36315.1 zinc-dependent alcohol dehydrogenase family protein [Streptomyces sp. NBC_01750]
MRAVVFEEFGKPLEVREVSDPVPSHDGAVIRVEATGLCRSDWHGWMGHDSGITLPHVPGHELAGVIESVGSDVANWRPGDRVTVPFICACGRCAACARGAQQVCERQEQPGFTHWGSFAEYVPVHHADANLVALPETMSFATAASLGCRFATAFRAVVGQGRVRPGEWVAVHGCGGVGLSAVMIAAACGAGVVAVDVSPGALELARTFGATVCVNAATLTGSVAGAVREATGGGAHLSLDALGAPVTCVNSVQSLRRQGRHVQVGLLPDGVHLPMDRVVPLELEILGSHGMAAHAYPEMMAMVASGALRPDLLVTTEIGLDDVPAVLAALGGASGTGVTVITPHPAVNSA